MITAESAIGLASSLPGTTEQAHFERPSFRVKKKIFATFHPDSKRFVLKLTPVDQSVFYDFDADVFYPVNGAWGKQGWTYVELDKVRKDMFSDALKLAWEGVAAKAKGK